MMSAAPRCPGLESDAPPAPIAPIDQALIAGPPWRSPRKLHAALWPPRGLAVCNSPGQVLLGLIRYFSPVARLP